MPAVVGSIFSIDSTGCTLVSNSTITTVPARAMYSPCQVAGMILPVVRAPL